MNNRQAFFIAMIFLAAMVACVVPGLSTVSTPAPTVETGAIETMVAGTVSAAIVLTEQSVPDPTATLPPTPAPTETPTPEPIRSQSTLTRLEDGSTVFADERAGYEIKLPAGWLAVRINEQEYLDAFSLEEAANLHIQQSLLSVQAEDPNVFRLLAIDTKAEHIQNDFVTDMRFVLGEQETISLSSDADLKAIAEKISASDSVFKFEVTSVEIVTSDSGIPFGVIEAKSSFTNDAGADVGIYQKHIFFNVNAGPQSIIFTTLSDLKESLLPAFDAMLETIKAGTE